MKKGEVLQKSWVKVTCPDHQDCTPSRARGVIREIQQKPQPLIVLYPTKFNTAQPQQDHPKTRTPDRKSYRLVAFVEITEKSDQQSTVSTVKRLEVSWQKQD